ncbi:hypothetical protein [Spirosoma spitsbergense]|uniref:hypothetical protein n=1 Tax=Spirosoma spitsbergense TaxID=431554 RepID=UPI00036C251D|nr:hypothetical protein [Spirosoma spitsbergense]
MINYDDLLNESGILRSIAKLEAASVKFADTAIAQNERAKQSLVGLSSELADTRAQIAGLNNNQKGASTSVSGLKDDVKKLSDEYKRHQELLARNQQFVDLNTASAGALKKRLADLKTEYDSLDRSEARNVARNKKPSHVLKNVKRRLVYKIACITFSFPIRNDSFLLVSAASSANLVYV